MTMHVKRRCMWKSNNGLISGFGELAIELILKFSARSVGPDDTQNAEI